MRKMNEFERTAKDDFQRVWDNINELHEVTNITLKNMEDIYDKDILPLQNFKTSTENDMSKLREGMENFLNFQDGRGQQGGSSFGNGSIEASALLTKTKQNMDILEDEQQRQKQQLEKLQESQSLVRTEIQRIFEDIDHFKKQSQTLTQDQLKLKREIQTLDSVKITDLANMMDIHSRQLEDFGQFQEKSISDAENEHGASDSKFTLMSTEMQNVKSQIYYLTQTVLQLRGALKNTDVAVSSSSSTNDVPSLPSPVLTTTTSTVNDQKLALIESKVDQCAAQNDLMLLENNFSRKSDEFNQMFSNMNEQLKSVDKLATEFDTDVIETVKKNTQRIDRMEIADRKNNLIIKGIRQDKRLERAHDLEALLKKFFKVTLGLTVVNFEEAERMKPKEKSDVVNNGAPIKVRFPSVREKIKVLQACRNATKSLQDKGITTIEDFTEKVLHHRQSLASFARRRSRRSKKKWALKYDELYYNGQIFVFDENSNRVVAKSRA